MRKFLFLLSLSAVRLLATPCDGIPRIQGDVGLTCSGVPGTRYLHVNVISGNPTWAGLQVTMTIQTAVPGLPITKVFYAAAPAPLVVDEMVQLPANWIDLSFSVLPVIAAETPFSFVR